MNKRDLIIATAVPAFGFVYLLSGYLETGCTRIAKMNVCGGDAVLGLALMFACCLIPLVVFLKARSSEKKSSKSQDH